MTNKKDVEKFLTNIDEIHHPEKREYSTSDKKTNVMYLTTDCNLACEYCYEKTSREALEKQKSLTPSAIDNFLEEIAKREDGINSTLVIMGGEPMLKYDLIEHAIKKCIKLDKAGGWGVSIVSNGVLYARRSSCERLQYLLDLTEKINIHLSFEVSYDGTGQFRRVFPNGTPSKQQVKAGLENLVKHNIKFKISYVCSSANYANMLQDLIKMISDYGDYLTAITVGFAYTDLDKIDIDKNVDEIVQDIKKKLRSSCEYLFDLFNIPICNVICEYCNRCKNKSKENAYLSPTKEEVIYMDKSSNVPFEQF